ncbi:hypothetical protein GALL_245710 [mine drainage metagenome]|uniref:Uncharacterized protein n=1 Tax=mine drainage metagenome TaxID=410659 RepID=A0A1J5RDT3_9ZZZZ
MSVSLVDKLPDSSGKAGIRVWLKLSGYARRLLLGEAGDPWLNAPGYLAYFSQAHGLLRPDVAVLDVNDLLHSWASRHPELIAEMASKKRVNFPLRKLLETEGPRKLLAEVLEAVAGCARGQASAVLAVPSPRSWLRLTNKMVGRDDASIEDDDIEDAAMYMADFLRSVSSSPVGGILLEDGLEPAKAGDVERSRPITNVARHYRWGVVWHAKGDAEAISAIAWAVDGIISSSALAGVEKAVGLDVGEDLWSGGAIPQLAPGQFYFAEIPVAQKPETVLENIVRLR